MFNGIVETIGCVSQIEQEKDSVHLTIDTQDNLHHLFIGESIAINGVCLTVTQFSQHSFKVTVVPETLRLTNLADLTVGTVVNLERALKQETRISGHYVQGHIDGVGKILAIQTDGISDALLVKIQIPDTLSKYIVKKGFIALDGMSITVIDVMHDWLSVTFIPHTQQATIVKQYRHDSRINIEVDILSKYVEKLLGAYTCTTISNA